MNTQQPLISVIIPFFNRIDLTLQAVESVLRQTYQNFEIILVDDGSTEPLNTLLDIKDVRITLLQQENKGPSAARNLGMQHAKGDFFAFLDSDDLFMPEKLALQLDMHLQTPSALLSHTSYRQVDHEGKWVKDVHSGQFSGNVFPEILHYCPIAFPTVLITRSVFDQGIKFEKRYRVSEDIIFLSNIARFSNFIGIDRLLSCIQVDPGKHSQDFEAQVQGAKNILSYISASNPLKSVTKKTRVRMYLYQSHRQLAPAAQISKFFPLCDYSHFYHESKSVRHQ